MRHIALSRALVALAFTMVFSLAACGSTSHSQSNGSSSGASKGSNTPQSNARTVTSGRVVLVLNKPHYVLNEVISVTITNGLSAPIFASSYYTNCTLVLLEWKYNDTWLPRGRCPSMAAHVIALKPGSTILQQLSPASSAPRPTPMAAWQQGVYRISFFYSVEPDEQNTQGISVQSEAFTIG